MKLGVDYYPEHWPEERWETDADLMAKAGMSVVRLAEFAWARIEPVPGAIDFSWLDRAIETLAKRGIGVVLGTPTATPPQWLCDTAEAAGDPLYQVDREGKLRAFGTRRHYCANHPGYRLESARIADELARHYAGNTALVAWQIDNEFGCHDTTLCYCDHCRAAFAEWLEQRYRTIDALNAAWGTVFWSQEYRRFADVIVPAYTAVEQAGGFTHNPGLLLDFQRFSSGSIVAYQRLQIDAIRERSNAPITHNLMGHFPDIDYYDLAADLDFASWDNYPVFQWGEQDEASLALAHDTIRGTKHHTFWVMEQLSGPCGWSVLGATPAPGRIRLWNYQGVAHGADAIVHFRWRSALWGTEQYWYGVLDHDGVPRRRYEEIAGVGAEFARLSPLLDGTEYRADTLLVRSYDNLWSHRFQPHAAGLSYHGQLVAAYRGLFGSGAQIDVSSIAGLDRYRLVVAPMLNLTRPDDEAAIERFVAGGGTLVLTFRSGTREWTNAMRTTPMPGPFASLAGVVVEEFDALAGSRTIALRPAGSAGGAPADLFAATEPRASLWLDVLSTAPDVEVLATYASGFYAGRAAITRRHAGKGTVYYVGCDLDDASWGALARTLIADAAIVTPRERYLAEAPACVEASVRTGARAGASDAEGALFLLNHGAEPARVTLRGEYRDALRDAPVGELELEPYGVAVLDLSGAR